MKKRCFSCGGATSSLAGSGKRQKYCQNCSSRGAHRGRRLPASNPLKTKGAGKHFSAPLPLSVREQIKASKDWPNPIRFITPDGREGRVWLVTGKHGNKIIGDDRHWRVHVAEAIKIAAEEAKERKAERSSVQPADKPYGRQRSGQDRSPAGQSWVPNPRHGAALPLRDLRYA